MRDDRVESAPSFCLCFLCLCGVWFVCLSFVLWFLVFALFFKHFVIVRRSAHFEGLSFWFRWRVTGACQFILTMCLPLFLLLPQRIHDFTPSNNDPLRVLSCLSAFLFVFPTYVHMFQQSQAAPFLFPSRNLRTSTGSFSIHVCAESCGSAILISARRI